MMDIGWIFSYLAKNRELDPRTAEGILQAILRALKNCTSKDSGARSGHER